MEPSAVPRRSALGGGSRYELLVKIATGGTATVYVGRLRGSEGFSRLVAIKRAHPHLRDDPDARRMLVREATLASRIHHANVVAIQDVEESDDELLLVMSYVEGGTLAELLGAASEAEEPMAPAVALRIVLDACAGLSAVHQLADDEGRPLGLVHRDVSPQNVLVGVDGTARLTDFGLAKLTEVSMSSTAGVQGKVAYLAPEYVEGQDYTQASDVFSLGVVAWETLSGRRLFKGNSDADTLRRVVGEQAPPLSSVCDHYGVALDRVLARALHKDPARRPSSVSELSRALVEAARPVTPATHLDVGETVRRLSVGALARRRDVIRAAANPTQADTVSVLHDDLPLPARAAAPPEEVEVAVEPTLPLDPALLDDEHLDDEHLDDEDGLLDAETRKLPPARATPAPTAGGVPAAAPVDSDGLLELGRDRRRTIGLGIAVALGVAVVAMVAVGPWSAPATLQVRVAEVAARAGERIALPTVEPPSEGDAPPSPAAEPMPSVEVSAPAPAPRRPRPSGKPKPTSQALPDNPYKARAKP